jgi:ABC-type bacteriocin/lantibiotic exporter with double-glycine peptidase domain
MFRRFAFVRQNEESDCGAAGLVAVAMPHGRRLGLEHMRQLTGTDLIGTNLLASRSAAEKFGFFRASYLGAEAGGGAPARLVVAQAGPNRVNMQRGRVWICLLPARRSLN